MWWYGLSYIVIEVRNDQMLTMYFFQEFMLGLVLLP